jgi:hypothetical protein
MKNLKLTSVFLFILAFSTVYINGCGDDSTTNNNNQGGGGGWHPTLNINPGQQFVYTTDSLTPAGVPITKRVSSVNTILAEVTYPPTNGQLCHPVTGVTYDSTTNPPTQTPEGYWIRYDQASGKYYQYGIRQLINISQPGSWDVVGDFDAARGSSYFIGDIDYTVTLPVVGTVQFTGPLNGKIADSTTIMTTGNPPMPISCYRIEISTTVSGTSSLGPVSATVILDYYLGYASPTGIVELKLRPTIISLNGVPVPAVTQPGFDRVLFSHTP